MERGAGTTVDGMGLGDAATLAGDSVSMQDGAMAFDATLALDATTAPAGASSTPSRGGSTLGATGRGTLSVLPRVELDGARIRLTPTSGPRYERKRALGEGGMGEVALVEDRDIGRTVAMKRLRADVAGQGALARFVDEVKVTGALEHPNIVPIHDVGVDADGQYFFVMKYVDGETLESVIDRLRANDPAAVRQYGITRRLEIFEGLLRALEYAHDRGVLHRDVKPANVMVGRHGEVVLMDWGIARPIGEAERPSEVGDVGEESARPSRASDTHRGALIGTPLYMSPEQAAGQTDSLDARSDLYSACVVLFEMLTLRALRGGKDSVMQIVASAVMDDAPPWSTMLAPHPANRDGMPAEFVHFLVRGLRRAPADRWQTASEILFELEAIRDGRCRVQCPFTLTKRALRELGHAVDRRPMPVLSALTVGLLGVAGLAGYALVTLVSG